MILPVLMALTLGVGSTDAATLEPQAIVERIESRFQKLAGLSNLYIAMECPTDYGTNRLAYGRRDDGVVLDGDYQDWQKGRAPNQLGEDSTIRRYDNGWVTEVHRDFGGERASLRYGATPPEPRYELRMMLGFCWWSSPQDARSSILEDTHASVRV